MTTVTRPYCPAPPLVVAPTVDAPHLADQADAAWQLTQVAPAALPDDPSDPTHVRQALRLLLERLLNQEVPLPSIPYFWVGAYWFGVCWVPGPTGREYALALVSDCETDGCPGVVFSAAIRSLADLGAAWHTRATRCCPACAARSGPYVGHA